MKPRNHVVLAMLKLNKKSGAHVKSNKAVRRKEKVQAKKEAFASFCLNIPQVIDGQ